MRHGGEGAASSGAFGAVSVLGMIRLILGDDGILTDTWTG